MTHPCSNMYSGTKGERVLILEVTIYRQGKNIQYLFNVLKIGNNGKLIEGRTAINPMLQSKQLYLLLLATTNNKSRVPIRFLNSLSFNML